MANSKAKNILFYFLTFLLVLLVIEIGLQAINGVAYLVRKKKEDNPLLRYLPDKQMANKIWNDSWDAINNREYTQFLEWAGKSYHSLYVNEDRQSGRKTWNPEAPAGRELTEILFFGGSSAWGMGARDDYTIPSYLSRMLNRDGARYKIINYGVPGYTFMQGLIHLVLLLKEGQTPPYVIFYDGFNEVYAAHQHGAAGKVSNLFIGRERMRWRIRDFVWNGIKEAVQKYCMTYRALNQLYLKATHKQEKFMEVAASYNDDQLRSLARDIVSEYLKPMSFLEHLSKAYNFKYICFWQPNMFTEKNLLPKEADIDLRAEDLALKKLCIYTNEYLQDKKMPHFYMLSKALENRQEPVYLDIAHLTEPGNEMMAAVIYPYLQKDLLGNQVVGSAGGHRNRH